MEYDIGRLLFILETASQLANEKLDSVEIPDTRLTVTELKLQTSSIRIHYINIGKRLYLNRVSDPILNETEGGQWTDYTLEDYFAVKSDGMGIVDIAFSQKNRRPCWIVNNPAEPFDPEFSEVKGVDIRGLRVIRDSRKCRAITVLSRTGGEPFFYKTPYPPEHVWVDVGFPIKSPLAPTDPFSYVSKATYIPFKDLKEIVLYLDPSRVGVQRIALDHSGDYGEHVIHFSSSSTYLKFLICAVGIGFNYPWLQFEVNGEWIPPIHEHCFVIHEVVLRTLRDCGGEEPFQ
ncbi:hypothetical protein LOZ12_006660 [Ophidiomyces ophidiicola]|uniref:Uncharacterized protein n=1 Tax=Ophidiomyces ophidiicola TaxID=1387563 RepID=A0ACB8UYB2_9EURO|nr:hypothetical protein LOZ64_006696 [Ophidiomyces ophidiicola]KAI1948050.1 hypothetical protein LOZ62_002772 [Ophidiomyces ophidiicola]KAI1948321.1 hypothetical protein LOZ59_006352 [Ophidiomyces ophidiicola]KAI1962206.1 hypothetical protein LOZ56_006628 [Ophidiomyces ophidiicola]KAI1998984.1 hypothetical protein LOZ50_006688 [Ophidiomyces ophidiicola]